MKKHLTRVFSVIFALLLLISAIPFSAYAEGATYNQIVNAATDIIIKNEGFYNSVVRNDNGALSIGVIGWHATNALNLLKDIVARNPSQALNILGAALYNEVVTASYWETRIPSISEASAISMLISTAEGKAAQNQSAHEYISSYINHAISLGINEPMAMVFFADYQNQNGYTGAERFYRSVIAAYGYISLETLYGASSRNNRRTRTYNFCRNVVWSEYTYGITPEKDGKPPEIKNVAISDLSDKGYTVSCEVEDNIKVTKVYFAVYCKESGANTTIWYEQEPENGKASHTVRINEFGNRSGEYCTFIYAFDEAGNYSYAELNVITVPDATPLVPDPILTVSSDVTLGKRGTTIIWDAHVENGNGNFLYYFELYRNNKLIKTRSYLDYSSFTYKAEESGEYKVRVTAKDISTSETLQKTSSISDICTEITNAEIKTTLGATEITEADPGSLISWTANASGGEGKLHYQFSIFRNGIFYAGSSSSASNTFSRKLNECGIYKVVVSIMDDHSQVISAESKSLTVFEPIKISDISFSSTYAAKGMTMTCKADIRGGTDNHGIVFRIFADGREVITSETLFEPVFTFDIPGAGVYTAVVEVSDIETSSEEGGIFEAAEKAKKGDVNGDGRITTADARSALRISVRLEIPLKGIEYAGDLDGNGRITPDESRKILRVAANIDTFD